MEQRYDCLVVGAGLAGAVAARELAERGLCVLVITHDGEFLRESGARVVSWLPMGKQDA